MVSPLSPIVANIYMENFEVEAISSAPNPPQFWRGMSMTLSPSCSHPRKKNF